MSAAVFVALVVYSDSLCMEILFCSAENLYLYLYISFMHGMSTMGPCALHLGFTLGLKWC